MRRLRARHQQLLDKEAGRRAFRPGGDLRVALVYPNLYPVAMGNLGFQVVYDQLNQLPGVSCERAVLPEGPDLRRLERRRQHLVSLETGTPLDRFDVLAFSVTFELDFLNMVRMLTACGIPVRRRQRTRHHPYVLAGGAALTVNHAPLVPLLDGWFLGEAEGRLEGWAAQLREARLAELRGPELWSHLAAEPRDPAAEVDRSHRVTREAGGPRVDFRPAGSQLFTPEAVFGKTALVEICRGCPWRCSFCVAKDMYGSFRRARPEDVLAYAETARAHTDRIGIVGAGISAYPRLAQLLADLREMGFSASLSSLRLDRVDDALLEEVQRHGQRTLTVAPESFSDRLSDQFDKSLDLGKIVAGLRRVGPHAFEKIKLYMIAGMPEETEADHEVAFATAEQVVGEGACAPGQLEFSYSLLLPRPGTVLGRAPLLTKQGYKRTRKFLEARARKAGVGLKVESYRMAQLCDLMCRGDEEVGERLAAWADETAGREPFQIPEGEYRAYIEGLVEKAPAYLETITPSSADLARQRARLAV